MDAEDRDRLREWADRVLNSVGLLGMTASLGRPWVERVLSAFADEVWGEAEEELSIWKARAEDAEKESRLHEWEQLALKKANEADAAEVHVSDLERERDRLRGELLEERDLAAVAQDKLDRQALLLRESRERRRGHRRANKSLRQARDAAWAERDEAHALLKRLGRHPRLLVRLAVDSAVADMAAALHGTEPKTEEGLSSFREILESAGYRLEPAGEGLWRVSNPDVTEPKTEPQP
jgi:hypothetical protein